MVTSAAGCCSLCQRQEVALSGAGAAEPRAQGAPRQRHSFVKEIKVLKRPGGRGLCPQGVPGSQGVEAGGGGGAWRAEVLAIPLPGSGLLGTRAPAHWQRRGTRGRRAHGLLAPRAGQGRGVGGLREGGDPSKCSLARR